MIMKRVIKIGILVVVIIVVFLTPTILRNILRARVDNDPWHMMNKGIVKEVGSTDLYYIVVDVGEEYDFKLYPTSGKTVVFNNYGLPSSEKKIKKGMTVELYSETTVVYDESNYIERGEKRTDIINKCLFIWIE